MWASIYGKTSDSSLGYEAHTAYPVNPHGVTTEKSWGNVCESSYETRRATWT